MRTLVMVLGLTVLAACGPTVPDSGASTAGPGFDTYQDYSGYRNDRDATLNGTTSNGSTLPPAQTTGDVTTPVAGATPTPTRLPGATIGISDEQDFGAVADRETIESDAERLKALKANYTVVQPTAVPTRAGSNGPNIVAYAINTQNPIGQKLYRRSAVQSKARAARNCAKYNTPDQAQEAFLKAGGPDRDKLAIDPDGDGFACAWDPRPYRQVARR